MDRRCRAICAAVGLALLTAGSARAQPAGPVAAQEPPAGSPLPTEGLMAPAPVVPPRSAYQVPSRPPAAQPTAPEPPDFTLPEGATIPVPSGRLENFRYTPRYGRTFNSSSELLPDKVTRRIIFTGGVILNAWVGEGRGTIELAADDAVVWVRGKVNDAPGGFDVPAGEKTEVEVYLSGNVVVRTETQGRGGGPLGSGPISQTLRAAQVYYDIERSRAVALTADLEMGAPALPDAVHLKAREVQRLGREQWEFYGTEVFSSKLPSDPGLKLSSNHVTMTERPEVQRNVFGIPYRDLRTGEKVEGTERLLTLRNAVTRFEDVPVFYLPYMRVDANDPLGPLMGVGFGQDRMFGTQLYTSWNIYKLLALRPPPGHQWSLHLDYLSARGFGYGTDYSYFVPRYEDDPVTGQRVQLPAPLGRGFIRAYGIDDKRTEDVLGGNRGPIEDPFPPGQRGRAFWRHQQEILEGMYFQGQIAYVHDQNFIEQYYKQEWDFGPNQETFAYLTYQKQNAWVAGLVEPRLSRPWIAQTQFLPRVDGALIGQSFFDLFVYNVRGSATYAETRPSEINPGPVLVTDQRVNTGRFDVAQELSLPFQLGPVKFAPYGVLDLTQYTEDLEGKARGRAYGGGGVRGSVPFSRLYPDISSELFNVRGIYHKATVSANWYAAKSDTPYYLLPLVDRLNDDAVDQAYRNMRELQTSYVPGPPGQALQNSPIFNPQLYAIRRLVDNRVDTLDTINVVQMDLRQRWQTKRGYPGLEHTVDVVMLDVSASYFPDAQRDNFGKPFSFLEYAFQWNVGDRVGLVSSGWFDPFEFGTRYYNVGMFLDRPDRTNFYLGYRQTDPVNSKQVTASVGYQLSRRYYVNLGASYDFGIQQALSNTLTLTRTGSDLTMTVGVTYNALVNNFGVQFLLIPNLLSYAAPGRFAATPLGR